MTQYVLFSTLRDLTQIMTRHLEEMLRPFDLTEAEFRVLLSLFLEPHGTSHPTELSASAGESLANVSRMSNSFFRRRLITRTSRERDRRRVTLQITEKGRDFVHCALPPMFSLMRTVFERVSALEQELLVKRLTELQLASARTSSPVETEITSRVFPTHNCGDDPASSGVTPLQED